MGDTDLRHGWRQGGKIAMRWSLDGARPECHVDQVMSHTMVTDDACMFIQLSQKRDTKVCAFAVGVAHHIVYCGRARSYHSGGISTPTRLVEVCQHSMMHVAGTAVLVLLEMLVEGSEADRMEFIIFCPDVVQHIVHDFTLESEARPRSCEKFSF
jgi:hypothetical protein